MEGLGNANMYLQNEEEVDREQGGEDGFLADKPSVQELGFRLWV